MKSETESESYLLLHREFWGSDGGYVCKVIFTRDGNTFMGSGHGYAKDTAYGRARKKAAIAERVPSSELVIHSL